ncbi:hypothetical protein PAECIP112173_03401 [Paenibacillus sp. JJ-100]|uniref:hypothetical protein n=1 Tax=Paenibacillus sp. JJ-100 TaxID=2974896 RepID=UPI0022FF8EF2|nr:hypothetical protein [Paenibacillus sp. JJ-100]CAI6082011.1 hypothetical protein PAECIP112173_03401 [Paenibacillus sp. JJ-100]
MKAVPKVNIDGLYIEDALVDDSFSGVVPFYTDSEPMLPSPDQLEQPEVKREEEEAEREISGYLVGVPVPTGLFWPKFNIAAWNAYQDRDTSDQTLPELWIEGLGQVEIDELTKSQPAELTEIDMLKLRLADSEAENKRLAKESNANQIALMELHTMLLSMTAES